MASIHLNPWAILLAAALAQTQGFFFFSPKGLLVKAWHKDLYGRTLKPHEMNKKLLAQAMGPYVLLAIVTAAGLSCLLELWRAAAPALTGAEASLSQALGLGILLWAAFVLPHALNKVVWQFKPWRIVLTESSYEFSRMMMAVVVLWIWR
jgi:hypothetical protein